MVGCLIERQADEDPGSSGGASRDGPGNRLDPVRGSIAIEGIMPMKMAWGTHAHLSQPNSPNPLRTDIGSDKEVLRIALLEPGLSMNLFLANLGSMTHDALRILSGS